jgi:hypothetical protein
MQLEGAVILDLFLPNIIKTGAKHFAAAQKTSFLKPLIVKGPSPPIKIQQPLPDLFKMHYSSTIQLKENKFQ